MMQGDLHLQLNSLHLIENGCSACGLQAVMNYKQKTLQCKSVQNLKGNHFHRMQLKDATINVSKNLVSFQIQHEDEICLWTTRFINSKTKTKYQNIRANGHFPLGFSLFFLHNPAKNYYYFFKSTLFPNGFLIFKRVSFLNISHLSLLDGHRLAPGGRLLVDAGQKVLGDPQGVQQEGVVWMTGRGVFEQVLAIGVEMLNIKDNTSMFFRRRVQSLKGNINDCFCLKL